ncbi:hypothetical protein KBZ10_00680 [Streptomyces sp. F63]|uniref:hypothetical protein n=1 Tax=Streptomyces sp. F63 TaxID=2824887 RepID=UPI001B38D5FE|nr:hypothetical protein [Streptomyces sp. F63]MBQ0983077.1 hypothetical protein [Streptomyces sp. F63]
MRFLTDMPSGLLGALYSVSRALLVVLLLIFGVELIRQVFPDAVTDAAKVIEYAVQFSSDDYVATFVRDRLFVFAVVGVALILWMTHKWPTLIKTAGQALNPFARIGVATVSAVAAVLVALILAGPLGQSRSQGECESSFSFNWGSQPSLASNTKCRGGGNGGNPGD